MSCFIVPDYHIDILVSWAMAHKAPAFFSGITPRELAQLLYAANVAAVKHRYGDSDDAGEHMFLHRDETQHLQPVQIIKACDCLEYQCCDAPDWAASPAARALDVIRTEAVHHLPGYSDAAWCLDQGVTA